MLEVLDAPAAITDEHVPASPIGRIEGAIEFRHLTFRYGDVEVLHDVSLKIAPGTTTAIVGATGSGKSTLLGLLPRLHDAPPGTVFIDGVDVREVPLATLRGAIGFVAQESFLFSASVADNIALGLPRAESRGVADRPRSSAVESAAATARLDKDIETFPNGYDTLVGERGITLSGGQKQRTAIARALVMSPSILILDDALSAVDTHTEEEILQRLSHVMRQRTSIIVSHRVSTVRGADQIVVLDHGRVAEFGAHETLVRRGGLYAELYRKQLLEEELAAS
jgi:ATP-binding cassette subfamily B protein